MPQPTVMQVHVQASLTNIAVAYLQDQANYIADQVFPIVPVMHQADKYFIFSKDDFFRDEATARADGVESSGGGFNLSTGTYSAQVYAHHKDLGAQTRDNADPSINMDIATTKFVMQRLMIKRERIFASNYLKTSLWGTSDNVGTAGGTAGGLTPAFWNDDASGDPFTDIANAQTTILQNTGHEANTLVISYAVYQALRKHPLVVDRVKYTTRADASKITPELLASAFDVERVVVSKAVYNTSPETNVITGSAGTMAFIAGKHALLCHSAPSPGLMIPTAGYIFAWSGFTGLNTLGVRIAQIAMPWLGLETVRTEGEMAFDMQAVGVDLGQFFSGIVQ